MYEKKKLHERRYEKNTSRESPKWKMNWMELGQIVNEKKLKWTVPMVTIYNFSWKSKVHSFVSCPRTWAALMFVSRDLCVDFLSKL